MTNDLERLIRADTVDDGQRLADIEDGVWALVGRREARRRLVRVQGLAISAALLIGLTNGGLMMLQPRPEPSEMRVFTVQAALSPLGAEAAR